MRFPPIIAAVLLAFGFANADDDPKKGPSVRNLTYSSDGKYLAAVSWLNAEKKDIGYATVWELPSGKVVYSQKEPKGIPTAAFSPDGSRFVVGSFGDDAFVVDTASWKLERKLPGHGAAVRGLAFTPDGKTLAASNATGTIQFWNTADWTVHKTMDNAHTGRVYAVLFTKDGKTLASCGEDNRAKLWNWRTGEVLHEFKKENIIRRIRFTADERHLLFTSWDATVNIGDCRTGKVLTHFTHYGSSADDMAISRDGTLLALAGRQPRVSRLNLNPVSEATLQELRRMMKGWDDDRIEVRDKASKDIAALGASVADELGKIAKDASSPEIRLRARLARTAAAASPEPIFKAMHPEGEVESVAFAPDDRTLATGGADGVVRLWNIATGQETMLLRQYPADLTAPKVPRSEY